MKLNQLFHVFLVKARLMAYATGEKPKKGAVFIGNASGRTKRDAIKFIERQQRKEANE